jgi:hypothetical protein
MCLLTIACNNINAQCTPNLTGPSSQISPDSAMNLPHGMAGFPYATDIQLYVGHDTVTQLGTATINYYKINNVTGMPPGFNYACNPSTCQFPHDAAGCIHLSGPALTNSMAGTYNLTVYLTGNVTLGITLNIPDTIRYYKIIIDSAFSGIPSVSTPTQFEVFQNVPNPVNGVSEIDYYSTTNAKIAFKVVNVLGMVVQNKVFDAKTGMNQIYVSSKDIAPGIYMYSVSNGTQTITKRMVIGNR